MSGTHTSFFREYSLSSFSNEDIWTILDSGSFGKRKVETSRAHVSPKPVRSSDICDVANLIMWLFSPQNERL